MEVLGHHVLVTGTGQVALETRDGWMMTGSIGITRRMAGVGSNGCYDGLPTGMISQSRGAETQRMALDSDQLAVLSAFDFCNCFSIMLVCFY